MGFWKMAAGGAGILGLLENFRELHGFRTTEYDIRSEKMRGETRVLFLSDLHNHRYGFRNRRLVEAVRQAKPDLILIGGDMLVGKEEQSFAPAVEFLRQITGEAPVYYANGNHEQRMKEQQDRFGTDYLIYKRTLKEMGVTFLENETVKIPLGETVVRLTGLEIPLEDYTRFYQNELRPEEIRERIGDCDREAFTILLAHNPSYMKEYLAWGADLILSGHFHGGLVRLPGVGAVFSPSFQVFPAYSGGHYREGDQEMVVSKGLGTHTFHVRLFNPAEAVLLRIHG